ncbi:MAG TPA: bifunctional UDP-N-acetylglucosamine diphosphorylase/glucosamine-1-phosphate N-acetyltransferase GlmU [Acidimicrobiia bacterium]|nr:bifunctional UDP-N-acetylglucosamine diphosphorylase/glucosamine-1-phosphate N-acetyltransferase GlmU [Acidimicrobiia bacterium]
MSLYVIVLAAGQGTRMKSDLPKVLHPALGRPMVHWVLDSVASLQPEKTLVVVGHGAEEVAAALPAGTVAVTQEPQLGTGHAVHLAMAEIADGSPEDTVLVVYGDMPLLGPDLLRRTIVAREGKAAAMVSFRAEEPTGYGRVVRDGRGQLQRVVEEQDANDSERQLHEVNAGVYAFSSAVLRRALGQNDQDNAQKEYYLPDVIPVMIKEGGVAIVNAEPDEVAGVNSQDQLSSAEAQLRKRINLGWQQQGVWMQDPGRVYIDPSVTLAPGVRLYPGVHLEGSTVVSEGAVIGPEVFAVDSEIGARSRVWYSVLRNARVAEDVEVGPYASLRPGTVLAARSKAGTFVEMKNTSVGEGAKVPHLSYLGDATVGARTNIGAGTITCNYNGYEKLQTTIGADVFVGSDTMFIAPVEIGDGAVTGAGSVISNDVPPGALAVERSPQKEIPDYAQKLAARYRNRRSED